jgi:hypothetical protein
MAWVASVVPTRSPGKDTAITIRKRDITDPALASLIERSGELKRQLIEFAQGPRFERQLTAALLEAAGPENPLTESQAISVIDHFVLRFRLPDGKTIIDRFVAARTDLPATERDMLLGWRDSVEGIFEIRSKHKDSVTLLNLIDDLEYRTYTNMGPVVFRPMREGDFVFVRLVPIAGVWLVSGMLSPFPRSSGSDVAKIAFGLATEHPELVFRNPVKVDQGWEMMRRNRAQFIDFFGTDEVILPPAEAQGRLNAQLRRQEATVARRRPSGTATRARLRGIDMPAFKLDGLYGFDTVGIIFDEVDGLNFYPDYGMLRDLFADPARASRKEYADLLRVYLREETIAPLPLCRLAAAYPETVDAVFRKVLRQRDFTWSEHGDGLLRKRKPWYYAREPRPGVSVIGDRLIELASQGLFRPRKLAAGRPDRSCRGRPRERSA